LPLLAATSPTHTVFQTMENNLSGQMPNYFDSRFLNRLERKPEDDKGTISMVLNDISAFFTSQIQAFRDDLSHPAGFVQFAAIGFSILIAWFFAQKTHRYFKNNAEEIKDRSRIVKLNPAQSAQLLGYLFCLLLLWFSKELLISFEFPATLLHMTISLVGALMVIRFASFYIKSIFWSRFVYVICVIVLFLRIFKLWEPTVKLLSSMTFKLGKISFSVWGLIEAIIIFMLLYAVAGVANRFVDRWLTTFTKLTSSDRTLLFRIVRALTLTAAFLISLGAAGIHMTAIAVTGGAIGLGIGVGLQKIGSNIISGIMLLISKPIREGDVITFEESFGGADWGWVTNMSLNYVQVATRSGSLLLIPNEVFITQKIENLSYGDNLVRLKIPFGISYESDLNIAKALALEAGSKIDRILKDPAPKCLITDYGDSTVNFQLRVWINDPKNGISGVKDAVLMAVWDAFHANNIDIAFPQRDLHIKSTVPFTFVNETARPEAKDSLQRPS
jgi:small-conductance mechanosensitive channel